MRGATNLGQAHKEAQKKPCLCDYRVRKKYFSSVCLCVLVAALEGVYKPMYLHVFFCVYVMTMSKHLTLIVRFLPNQLSYVVNKSVLIGSALRC